MITQTLPPQIPVNRTNPEGGITLKPADLHAVNQRPYQIASLFSYGTLLDYRRLWRLQDHMVFVRSF